MGPCLSVCLPDEINGLKQDLKDLRAAVQATREALEGALNEAKQSVESIKELEQQTVGELQATKAELTAKIDGLEANVKGAL